MEVIRSSTRAPCTPGPCGFPALGDASAQMCVCGGGTAERAVSWTCGCETGIPQTETPQGARGARRGVHHRVFCQVKIMDDSGYLLLSSFTTEGQGAVEHPVSR